MVDACLLPLFESYRVQLYCMLLCNRQTVLWSVEEEGISINIIGKRIKHLRKSKNMTQEELGKLLGVSKSAIQKYENGIITDIKASKLKILCDVFGVFPHLLMYENEREYLKSFLADHALKSEASAWVHEKPEQKELIEDMMLYVFEHRLGTDTLNVLARIVGLNKEGLNRVVEYADDLLQADKYRL